MGIMGKHKVQSPLTGIKHKTRNPCANGHKYKSLKKTRDQILDEVGLKKPKSPLG